MDQLRLTVVKSFTLLRVAVRLSVLPDVGTLSRHTIQQGVNGTLGMKKDSW